MVLAAAHDPGEALVLDRQLLELAGLADIFQAQLAAADLGVAVAQRRRAEAAVGLGIAVIADADPAEIEQPHDRGDHRILGEPAAGKIRLHLGAQRGEHTAEIGGPLIFLGLGSGAEVEVVAILLPALVVIADRLDMAVGQGAEPGIAIGRRQRDAVQPVDLVAIGDAVAARRIIGPAVLELPAVDPRLRMVDEAERCGQGGHWSR